MIENAPLNAALAAKARAQGIELRATAVTGFAHGASRIEVSFGDGDVMRALLVAADGAQSRDARAGRHRDPRLVVRAVGDRHHGRA